MRRGGIAWLLAASLFVYGAGCGDGDSATPAYTLEFAVTTPGRIGALQFEVEHLGSSGGFIGRGDAVDCEPLVDAIVASNSPGERILKVGLISLDGIPVPAAILRCGFQTTEEVSPSSFNVAVTDASRTDGSELDPPPTVVISSVTPR